MLQFIELIKWWWESNVDWLRIYYPWSIPVISLMLPTAILLKSLPNLIYLLRLFVKLKRAMKNKKDKT